MSKVNLKQQLRAYENGSFLDSDGSEDTSYYLFYDWFCRNSSLKNKAHRLFSNLKTFLKNRPDIDLTKHYVFFKNNCPMVGRLYDDFRICDIESGDVVYTVTPRSGHSSKAEIWGRENDFKKPISEANTFRGLFEKA